MPSLPQVLPLDQHFLLPVGKQCNKSKNKCDNRLTFPCNLKIFKCDDPLSHRWSSSHPHYKTMSHRTISWQLVSLKKYCKLHERFFCGTSPCTTWFFFCCMKSRTVFYFLQQFKFVKIDMTRELRVLFSEVITILNGIFHF